MFLLSLLRLVLNLARRVYPPNNLRILSLWIIPHLCRLAVLLPIVVWIRREYPMPALRNFPIVLGHYHLTRVTENAPMELSIPLRFAHTQWRACGFSGSFPFGILRM